MQLMRSLKPCTLRFTLHSTDVYHARLHGASHRYGRDVHSDMERDELVQETRMFGDLSAALMQESRRATLTNTLLKYNQNLVHSITREIRFLDSSLDSLVPRHNALPQNLSQGELCAISIYSASLLHNRRCLVAYHKHRLNILKSLYWKSGCALPLTLNAPHIRPNLSPAEVDFLRQYDDMVREFRDEFKDISGDDNLGGE